MSVEKGQITSALKEAMDAHVGDMEDISRQELDSIIEDFSDQLHYLKKKARDEDDVEEEDSDEDIEGSEE